MECLIAIGTWVAGKVADYTVVPVGHKLGYIFHYRRNLGNLITETQDLNLEKKRMEDLVDAARRNGEEVYDHVKDWLSKAGEITQQTEKLLGDENQATMKCTSRGPFQNLVQRYQLSRKAKKMGESVSKIKCEIRFDNISYRPKLQSNFRNNDFISFDTRKEITMKIMEMLEDGNIKMIGVYGIPGAGKTTLVKEISSEALDRRLFNDAIVITVSQTPNLKSIQQEIAEKLDLKVDKESISERALLLQNRLKGEEKFLIILDDVWNNELNFKDLGILIESDDQKGSKILLTSRFERVLRDDIGVEKTFLVELLSEDEAWDLFIHIVGDLVKNPDFQQYGNEIVKECACLPIAIVTIAHALKNRALPFWRDALGQLQRSNLNIKSMHEKVYTPIKLCYDYLQSEEAKLLILLCCLHEEDASISMENLMRYGIGLDIFKGVRTLQEARDRVYSLVDELKDCCLLLDNDAMGTVRMHDVICDVAMSIGKERHIYCFRDGAEVEECKKRKTLEDSRAISLPNGYVGELVCESFEYKQLELIWMGKKKSLDIISNNFFEKTKELRVLCFFSQNLEVLPPSLCLLQNLCTLCMNDCQLGDIALIGELKNLEILDLSKSSIKELPRQIGQLTRLCVLDLSECEELIVIHPNIISHLTRLEELYVDFKNWDKDVEVVHGEIRNASLFELKDLVRLTNLELKIPDIRMLPKDLFSDKLKRYKILIQIDDDEDDDDDDDEDDIDLRLLARVSPSRYLAICELNESIILQEYGLETLLKRCDVLYLSDLQGLNNIVYELDKKGFPELKMFCLKNNDKIQYLINTIGQITCSSAFGSLELLWLVNLTNLEKICHGELIAESFKRLSAISVTKCKRLKNLLPFSIATQLEKIEIIDCEMMEEIFTHEIDDDDDEDMVDEFPNLCSLDLENLSKLRKFCSKLKKTHTLQNQEEALIVDSSMPLFSGKFVSFPKLEKLKLSGCDFTKIWDDQFQLSSTSFRNLTKLVVGRCNFMKNLFSSSVAASLEHLYSLNVSDCRTMKVTMRRNENIDKMSFPKLSYLTLENLPSLVSFSSSIFIEFPVLAQLYIKECPAFKTFISDSEQNSCTTMPALFNEKAAFPSLNRVVIEGMDKLKMIWQYESAANCFCKLKNVTIRNCKNLMKIIPSGMQRRLRNVTHLEIYDCEMVEEVFEIQMSNNIEETYHVVPAQLTHLRLYRLAKLKYVWSKDPQATLTFPNLEKVVGSQCPSLVSIFPPSIAKCLFQLKRLDIDSCGIEEIVAKEEGSGTAPSEFVFPQLEEMQLKNLPNLVSFYPGLHTSSWPLLTTLHVIDCMKVKLFALEFFKEKHGFAHHYTFPIQQPLFFTKFSFPRLEKLQLFRFHFQKIWDDPLLLGSTSFRHTTKLEVGCCEFLGNLFPSAAMAASFEQLYSIEIRECWKMEEIICKNKSEEKMSFSKLKRLKLRNLPNLVRFSSEIFIEFPVLTELSIQDCPEFGTFISKSEENSCTTIPSLFNEKFVSFPKLEKLEILGCHFKKIWIDQLIPWSTSFRNLTQLVIVKCEALKNLFSYAIAASFEQLCFLEVRDCIVMEEIVMTANERMDRMSFPKLKLLELEKLPNLVRFSSAIFIEFPLLTELSIKGCPEFGSFISMSEDNSCTTVPSLFNKFVSFPILEKLELSGCHFTMIWDDQLLPSSISLHNLKTLSLGDCKFLKNLFTSTVALSFEGLCDLDIRDCTRMEEIMSNNEMMDKVSFPDLEYLKLKNLPSLTKFSSAIFIEFPLLMRLSVNGCPELKGFISKPEENIGITMPPLFNEKAAFPKLNRIRIGGMDNLKMIWHYELAADSFRQLENVTVTNCKNLIKIIPSTMHHRLCNLKYLKICDSEMVEEVGLPSMMLTSQGQFTKDFFGKLKEISVYNCKSLTKIFSYNVLRGLKNLSKLVISNCEMMEEVFDLQIPNDHQETSEITHIQLKELRLAILPKLKHVWSKDPRGNFTFQYLQSVDAYQCQNMENLFPPSVAKSLITLQKLHIKECAIEVIVSKEEEIEIEPHTFVFPQFEEMVLVNLPNLVSFYPGLHTSSWPLLTKMDVVDCMKVKVLMSEPFSFQEMHGLAHHDIPFQQPLFFVEKVGLSTPSMVVISQDLLTADIFGKLKEINVHGCKSLTKMFSSNILRSLHNLRKLVISNCEMLEVVFEFQISNDHRHETLEVTVPIHLTELKLSRLPKLKHVWGNDPRGTFTFQDLQMLNVHECQCLKILFPTSVAKNLPQLQMLYIGNCGIEQIVAEEKGQNQTIPTFVFPQLKGLTLHNLPRLMSFYPGLHTLKWPLLRWLYVSSFMKAKDLSLKFLRFQQTCGLTHQHISFQEPLFSIDEVTSSSQNEDMVGDQEECAGALSRLSGLRLYDMPNLLHLREESSQPQKVFQNLIDLDIWRCGRIKKLVSSSISFHNLETLKVRQCHGMPSLLTSRTARSMARLKCLIIYNSKRMAEIIVDAEEGMDMEGEIVLARLKTLVLDSLPSLTSFYSGKYMLGFPDLENVIVSRCFEMLSFSRHGNIVSTPKLHKLVTVGADHKKVDDINTIMAVNTPMDLNTIIPELWKSHPGTVLQQLFCGTDLALSNLSVEQPDIHHPTV